MDKNHETRPRELRGLYKNVKISVRTLDMVIAACIAVILLVVVVELRDPGFTVTFDSRGGTDVPAVKGMYGELLTEPEEPQREGYLFTGWYKEPGCQEIWDMDKDILESDIILYAGWKEG